MSYEVEITKRYVWRHFAARRDEYGTMVLETLDGDSFLELGDSDALELANVLQVIVKENPDANH